MIHQMLRILFITLVVYSIPSFAQVNRSYNGENNNLNHQEWGAAVSHFKTYMEVGFSDSISLPGGQNRPNPRAISNALGSQDRFMPNEKGLSDMVWGWGQFIDHDINLNDDNFSELHAIPIPPCEPLFDPACDSNKTMKMFRSISDTTTGTSVNNPRKFINEITSFIDGSAVYGSEKERTDWLRTFSDGKLKSSSGNLLPWNTIDGEYNSPIDTSAPFMLLDGFPEPDKFYVAGDVRANEQPGLTAFHTLWVREHNRLCDSLEIANPTWTDEELFQRARKMVGAMIQAITYEEFLPTIGVELKAYRGYDNTVNPSIMNGFSAAAYRFGHTMVNGRLVRFEENGDEISFGASDLRDGFFKPLILKDEGGVEPFFRGFAAQKHQFVDPLIMDDIRNFLFGPPGAGGIDLLSVNIARARERGLPDYNTIRTNLSLGKHPDFESLSLNDTIKDKLASVYSSVDELDPWIGFMSEKHLPNSIMGEGLNTILKMQFSALRDGDRYYYEDDQAFTQAEINTLKKTRLSNVILRNTEIKSLQDSVFKAVPRHLLSVELFPFPEVSNLKLSAYPNPVQKYFRLVIENRRPSNATLTILSASGQVVRRERLNLLKGENQFEFELSDELANGLYTILLATESGKGQLKLIKQ